MPDDPIRPVSPEDIDSLLAIERAAHRHPWRRALFEGCFGKRHFNYLLVQDTNPVGFYIASHVAGEGELLDIAVAPAHQGQGWGQQLLTHCLKQARALGLARIWLEVRRSNVRAIRLYQQQGFVETGLRKNYYPTAAGREDAVVMCCELSR